MLSQEISIRDCGDSSLRLTASYPDGEKNWNVVHSVASWLRQYDAPGLRGVVPAYDSLLIEFDPTATDHQNLRYLLSLRLETVEHVGASSMAQGKTFNIPVVFGDDHGPDLEYVAELLDLVVDDVIQIVCGAGVRVRCLAQAGAPMVDGPNFPFPIPRRKDPRTSVPAGSLAVAGVQGIVIPTAAPCGWQLLGRTPLSLVDPANSRLLSHQPGDTFKYFAITEDRWDEYAGKTLGDDDVC